MKARKKQILPGIIMKPKKKKKLCEQERGYQKQAEKGGGAKEEYMKGKGKEK